MLYMCKYPWTEGTNQNRHWNHHRWHATNSLKRNQLSCWCLYNHKGCTYRAPIRYATKTCSVVLLNKKKKYIYCYLKCIVYDKLLKPRQSFRITLYIDNCASSWLFIRIFDLVFIPPHVIIPGFSFLSLFEAVLLYLNSIENAVHSEAEGCSPGQEYPSIIAPQDSLPRSKGTYRAI